MGTTPLFPASLCQSLGLQSKNQRCLFMTRSQRLVSFFHPFAHLRYSAPTGNQTPLFSDQHGRFSPCPHASALPIAPHFWLPWGHQLLWLRLLMCPSCRTLSVGPQLRRHVYSVLPREVFPFPFCAFRL